MKAAVVTDLASPLSVREVPTPAPGAGEVLVRMEASGLCHTDIHAARGDWPVKPTPPFVPGHEGIVTGWETLCRQQRNSGYPVDGAFAEYAVVPAAFATRMPEEIPSAEASERKLDEVNQAIDEMLAGDIAARIVFRF